MPTAATNQADDAAIRVPAGVRGDAPVGGDHVAADDGGRPGVRGQAAGGDAASGGRELRVPGQQQPDDDHDQAGSRDRQRPSRAAVRSSLRSGAHHRRREEHERGEQRQPAPAQHVRVQVREAAGAVPAAGEQSQPEQRPDQGRDQERDAGVLVGADDERQGPAQPAAPGPPQVDDEPQHHPEEQRRADRERVAQRRGEPQEDERPDVPEHQPPITVRAGRGVEHRLGEVLAEDEDEVRQDAQGEQVDREPAAPGRVSPKPIHTRAATV
jgi:hypothetical protein